MRGLSVLIILTFLLAGCGQSDVETVSAGQGNGSGAGSSECEERQPDSSEQSAEGYHAGCLPPDFRFVGVRGNDEEPAPGPDQRYELEYLGDSVESEGSRILIETIVTEDSGPYMSRPPQPLPGRTWETGTVRGNDALLQKDNDSSGLQSVRWVETTGTVIHVTGIGISIDTIRSVAEGVRR